MISENNAAIEKLKKKIKKLSNLMKKCYYFNKGFCKLQEKCDYFQTLGICSQFENAWNKNVKIGIQRFVDISNEIIVTEETLVFIHMWEMLKLTL